MVLPRTDTPAGPVSIVAYVVTAGPAGAAALRAHVAARLPDYMVPAVIVPLAEMPLLPNGKLDRQALPVPRAPEPGGARKAPRTPLHRALAGYWAEVLRRETVGIDENFFELGGDSLLGTQLLGRVRRELEIDAQLADLFRHPTVEALATHLLESQ